MNGVATAAAACAPAGTATGVTANCCSTTCLPPRQRSARRCPASRCGYAGLHPDAFAALWLVASGTPWWQGFPAPRRWLLPPAYRFLPWLAQRRGALPGRRLGFGGTEARSLIHDWARVGLSGHYAAAGLAVDLDAAMHALALPVQALLFDADWLAPAGSMRHLLSKMPAAPATLRILSGDELGARADHFSWMKSPAIVADALASASL